MYDSYYSLPYIDGQALEYSTQEFKNSCTSYPIDNHCPPMFSTTHLEEMLYKIAESQLAFQQETLAFQEETKAQFQQIEVCLDETRNQLAQMANSIDELMVPREDRKSNTYWDSDLKATPSSSILQTHSKVTPNLMNSNSKTNVLAFLPYRLEKKTNDDEEQSIELEFKEFEEDESHLTREEDIDSDEEAAPLETCMTFGEDVLLTPKPRVGEDELNIDRRETLLVANSMVENSPMKDIELHEDPDFLGLEAFHQKFEKRLIKYQFLVTLYICTPCTKLSLSYGWKNVNLVCYKPLLPKSITATTMALSILAYHDVLRHALSCFLLLSPCIFVLLFLYVFPFKSYLLFALQWQDPP